MQYKGAIKWIVLLLYLTVFASCDRAPVDKDYLKSKEYSRFSKKQQQEYAAQVRSNESLQKYLAAFNRCDRGRKWDFPLQIDPSTLKKYGRECKKVADEFNASFRTLNIGYTAYGEVKIRWIVLKRKSVYEDSEFLAVTYRDSSLVDFQSLGEFRENLSQDISTVVEVSQKGDFIYISSMVNRNRNYPIKQQNTIKWAYRIDSLGAIRRHQ